MSAIWPRGEKYITGNDERVTVNGQMYYLLSRPAAKPREWSRRISLRTITTGCDNVEKIIRNCFHFRNYVLGMRNYRYLIKY